MRGFVLPAIPFLGWIISLFLGSGAVWVGANLLGWVQLTIMQLAFFAAGIYVFVAHVVPTMLGERRFADPMVAWFIAIVSIVFILLGVPKLILGKSVVSYTIVGLV